jgi:hypothetical protein
MANSDPTIIENLTAIGIILFILSLITEKITILIRKHTPHFSDIINTFLNLFRKKKKTLKKLSSQISEEKKAKEIMLFSFIVGTLVAFISNANIFILFRATDYSNMLFEPFNFEWDWKAVGFIFTGLFLSLGSKFFHDLLDTLLQIKNLKRKMNDEKTYQIETIKEFDEYLKLTEGELVRMALRENIEYLKSHDNVGCVGLGMVTIGENKVKCVSVNLRDGDDKKIPKNLYITLPSGRPLNIPVDITKNTGLAKIHLSPGDKIAKKNHEKKFGTFGCVLRKIKTGKEFLLTCSHVLTGGSSEDYGDGIPKKEEVVQVIDENGSVIIGKWASATRTKYLDIATISPIDSDVTNYFDGHKFQTSAKVSEKDVNSVEVMLCGARSGKVKRGVIAKVDCIVPVAYVDETVTMEGLISISEKMNGEDTSITKEGDSGAIILDSNWNVLGMIVAGDEKFSYAIPMEPILERMAMEIA